MKKMSKAKLSLIISLFAFLFFALSGLFVLTNSVWPIAAEESTEVTVAVPTQEGYIFGGYYTKNNGQGLQYFHSDGQRTQAGINAGATDETGLYPYWIDTWANPAYCIQPEGAGTSSNPYLIASAANLAWVANQTNFHDNTF